MKLYMRYFSIHLRSCMQYKTSFLLTTLGNFLVSFSMFLGIYYMFQRFHTVKDFSYNEVLLSFAILLLADSIAECYARGFDSFATMIGNGEFDRIMLRPRNEMFQVLASKIEFTRIGRMLQAIVMMIYAVLANDIIWSIDKILTVIFMVLGGIMMFTGLYIIYAALCFFTLEGLEFLNIFTDGGREFGKYPVSIYGKVVLKIYTFVVPMALFQYYPLLYLLDRTDRTWYKFLPFLACLFIIPCYGLWKFGVKHYKSTGS